MHLAIIAERLGHTPICITSERHIKQHSFLKRIKRMWKKGRRGLDCDIYVAKSDAYYEDANWAVVEKLPGFKVALCNSDKTFRETSVPYRTHTGNPVHERCDLYMPVNHTQSLIDGWGDKFGTEIIPVAHPVDPRMYKAFVRKKLYFAYLMNDLKKMREAYPAEEKYAAGFMGNRHPSNRMVAARETPKWCRFHWARTESPEAYIKKLCEHRACLDIRGFGDKSLRFSEAAIFGRTLICQRLPSLYSPLLVNDHNCIMIDEWKDLNSVNCDLNHWKRLAEQSTQDYIEGWSLLGQLNTIIARSGA
jgi:hypothetical protein